ncbi:hypothetical protein CF326_g5960 [Tilletia indica]|nr:hypothetical protein CF326_g5960 [Tilletia indica]
MAGKIKDLEKRSRRSETIKIRSLKNELAEVQAELVQERMDSQAEIVRLKLAHERAEGLAEVRARLAVSKKQREQMAGKIKDLEKRSRRSETITIRSLKNELAEVVAEA